MSNSPADAVPIPENSPRNKASDRFVYRGPSMAPIFRPGQILHVNQHPLEIAPGDVIVFHHQGEKGHVVHRVISISRDRFITRGDNNRFTDPSLILPEQVVGRVEKTDRCGQIRPVIGGWHGLWLARILYLTLQIKRFFQMCFSRPYRWLKGSGIAAKLWHPEISTIRFETQDGPLVKYIHKGKTVASCWTETNQWWFRRPYDFIIGPKLLK